MSAIRFQTKGQWSFIPGRAELAEPMNSQDLQDIAEISPAAIAESLLSFSGMCVVHPATPSWWEWRARWESDSDHIEIGMTLFDNDAQSCGGSPLTVDCSLDEMVALWSHLQTRHRGVWLHAPDGTMHTYDSFKQITAAYE